MQLTLFALNLLSYLQMKSVHQDLLDHWGSSLGIFWWITRSFISIPDHTVETDNLNRSTIGRNIILRYTTKSNGPTFNVNHEVKLVSKHQIRKYQLFSIIIKSICNRFAFSMIIFMLLYLERKCKLSDSSFRFCWNLLYIVNMSDQLTKLL